jgi:hypothetical protein
MANTVDRNKRLRQTYSVNVASIRRFDAARAKGAKLLEQKGLESIAITPLAILLERRKPAKPLK